MTQLANHLNDRQLRTVQQLAAMLADALSLPPPPEAGDERGPSSPRWRAQSLANGAAGIAILHGLRGQRHVGAEQMTRAWLACATREDLSAGRGAGLWFGAPAVAFAITTAVPGQCPRAIGRLDAAVTRLVRVRLEAASARMAAAMRPSLAEFDLVRGLAGLGAYLLHRDPNGELIRKVVTYLVRLTEPVPANDPAGAHAPGWWTNDPPSGLPPHAYPGGHADFGTAHGIAGPLALLALAMRRGVTVQGHTKAIETICRWLDAWRHDGPAGPWWPERIGLTEMETGHAIHQDGPARPSWCYGTPGLARAQQLAGLALGEPARQQQAEQALVRCLDDPIQLARMVDPGLCHGWAGLIATVWCAAADAHTSDLGAHLPRLADALLGEHARNGSLPPWQAPGLIEGNAGLALTLHTMTTPTGDGWLRCLLLT